jgi:asparagine N-glycosylation enzyme membrane subunit Stt3
MEHDKFIDRRSQFRKNNQRYINAIKILGLNKLNNYTTTTNTKQNKNIKSRSNVLQMHIHGHFK